MKAATDLDHSILAARQEALAFIAGHPQASPEVVIAFLMVRLGQPIRLAPFLPVDESISEDGTVIYCLVDGKPLKMLKRYIKRFGMTPESYREAFGLPADYPMTAPAYSETKRREAVEVGLGTDGNKAGNNLHVLSRAGAWPDTDADEDCMELLAA